MEIARNIYGFPATDDRVPLHTSDRSNQRIHERTLANIRPFVGAPRRRIDARIAELRREWDIERTLEANAAAVSLASVAIHAEILALRILRDDFSERARGADAALSIAMDT